MLGLQLLAVVGIVIAAGLSVRLLFWAVRGSMDDPGDELRMLGYMGGSFFLAMCFVGIGGMMHSVAVAGFGLLVLASGMFGITNAIIEAIIKRSARKV